MKPAAIAACLLSILWSPLAAQTPQFSLWADEERSSCLVDAGDWEPYDFYLFLNPGPDGAFAAEYKIVGVEGHICIDSTPNAFVSSGVLGTPYGPPGVSAPFMTCQTGTVWIYRYTVLAVPPTMSGYVMVDAHDDSGFCGIAICPGNRPLVEAVIYNYLDVNGYWCEGRRPILRSVEVVAADSLIAQFDPCPEGVYLLDSDNFLLYSDSTPAETIQVVPRSCGDCLTPLRLQGNLVPFKEYTLEAIDVCGLGWYGRCCNTSSIVFTWIPTATLLSSWSTEPEGEGIRISWRLSSIDDGVTFDVSRSDGAGFSPVGSVSAGAGCLDYEYLDREILPSRTYTYRVEYATGAECRLLFETGAVEMSPLPLALEQNHPNPFNPSTMIEFSLPAAGEVSLDVFDAAGRHVRTIQSGILPAGRHEAAWDGLDDRGGNVPSGVYFARLQAGKTVLSRKMVLLR
jgi:hypothetical protein